MRRPTPRIRREHAAAGGFLLLTTAFALAPVSGQSPRPLGASPDVAASPAAGSPAAPSVDPDATLPPGGLTPLPARITAGSCEDPGAVRTPLRGPVAGGDPGDPSRRAVYASISMADGTLDDLASDGVLMIGGDPAGPESAVACGRLDAARQAATDLAIVLDPVNDSGYAGTAMLHEEAGAVTVVVVVVAPAPEDPPSPAPSGGPTGIGASPVPRPSVQPGTSGAPPFSPLPAGSEVPAA